VSIGVAAAAALHPRQQRKAHVDAIEQHLADVAEQSSAPRGLTPQGRTALARLPGKRGARLEQAQAATASSTQAHASPTTETGQPGSRLPRTPATRPRALPKATPVGKPWDRQQRQVAPGTQRTRTGRSGALAAIRSSSAVKMPSRRSGWKSTI